MMTETTVDKINTTSKAEYSLVPISSSGTDVCRICHSDDEACGQLMSACLCSGSLRFVHEDCLNQWFATSRKTVCEACGYTYSIKTTRQWKWGPEVYYNKKNLLLAVVSMPIALTWIIGSIYFFTKTSVYTCKLFSPPGCKWQIWTKVSLDTIVFIFAVVSLYFSGKIFYKRIAERIIQATEFFIDTSSPPPKQKTLPENELSNLIAPESLKSATDGSIENNFDLNNVDPLSVEILTVYIGNVGDC